jgi:hypothetical protein
VETCDYTLPSWLSNSVCGTFGATIRINAKFQTAEVFGLGCQRRRSLASQSEIIAGAAAKSE